MILTRKRLAATMARIPSNELRTLIQDCVAVRAGRVPTAQVPWKEYRQAVERVAALHGHTSDVVFEPLDAAALNAAADASATDEDRTGFRHLVRLDRIELLNFGSYREETTIDLAPSGSRNVTVIVGSNGDGKSTVFHAVNWALFGDDFLRELEADQGKRREDLVNHAALADLRAAGHDVETRVLLWFTIAGVRYYVRRRFTTTRIADADSSSVVLTGLYKLDASGNHQQLPEDSLRQLLVGLPKSVKDFFLFDGERINRFAQPGAQRFVKDAIRRIVGLTELEDVAQHVTELAARLRAEQRKAADRGLAEAVEAEEHHRTEMQRRQTQHAETSDEIVDLRAMIEALEKRLLETPDTREIQKRRDIYQEQLSQLRRRLETCSQELRDAIASSMPMLALPAVEALRAELDREREVGAIPGVISRQLLQDLLDRGTCLCGADVPDGSEARRHLELELERVRDQQSGRETLLGLFYELGSVRTLASANNQTVAQRYREYWELVQRQDELEAALAGITLELEGLEIVDREGWEAERRAKVEQLSSRMAHRKDLDRRLEEDAEVLKALTSRVGELAAAEHAAAHLFAMAGWAEAAAVCLKGMIHEFTSLARIEAERRTTTTWRRLLPNVKNFTVVISEDFELSVTSPVGSGGLAQLSMGQQQCLGLAFITAIAQVAETNPPLVIDMPFGRLADGVAAEVAAALPMLTDQLVLFLLPMTEWNERIQQALVGTVARVVTLRFDEAASRTSVTTQRA